MNEIQEKYTTQSINCAQYALMQGERKMTLEGYTYLNKQRLIIVFKLRILNSGKQIWMLPLTRLVRTVSGGFRR